MCSRKICKMRAEGWMRRHVDVKRIDPEDAEYPALLRGRLGAAAERPNNALQKITVKEDRQRQHQPAQRPASPEPARECTRPMALELPFQQYEQAMPGEVE